MISDKKKRVTGFPFLIKGMVIYLLLFLCFLFFVFVFVFVFEPAIPCPHPKSYWSASMGFGIRGKRPRAWDPHSGLEMHLSKKDGHLHPL